MRAPKRAIRARRRTGTGVFGSRSMPRKAPWRASTRPHFSSRQTWVMEAVMRGRMRRDASNPPAAVDGDEAAEDRLPLHIAEAGRFDHSGEGRHVRESLDRLDQIAITVLVLRDRL